MIGLDVLILNCIFSLVVLSDFDLGAYFVFVFEAQLQVKELAIPDKHDLIQISYALHPLDVKILLIELIQVCVTQPQNRFMLLSKL